MRGKLFSDELLSHVDKRDDYSFYFVYKNPYGSLSLNMDDKPPYLKKSGGSSDYYHCLLCGCHQITSATTLKLHMLGRRHRRNYNILQQQRRAWSLDQVIKKQLSSLPGAATDFPIGPNTSSGSTLTFGRSHGDDDDAIWGGNSHDTPFSTELSYIKRMERRLWGRRWNHNPPFVCQLCDTGAMRSRLDVIHHCQHSREHLAKLPLAVASPELFPIIVRVNTLPLCFQEEFQKQHLIPYLAAKEAAFAGLESQYWNLYQLLHKLEVYEIRAKFVYLELAVWKASLVEEEEAPTKETTSTKNRSFSAASKIRRERRMTCKSTEILQNVFPYLQTMPRIQVEY